MLTKVQAAIRIKANYNPTAYSVEWAGVVTAHLKKQLSELALPAAPKLSLNVKSTFKGVLTEADTRDRWVARFTYLSVLYIMVSSAHTDAF
jgi:mediator of RNA polymerase II transcription subunit 12